MQKRRKKKLVAIFTSGKNIVVGIKAAPTVVAALPLDDEIVDTVDGSDFIGAGAMVKFAQQIAFGPGLFVVAGNSTFPIDAGAASIWEEGHFRPVWIAGALLWVKRFFGFAETVRSPAAD